MQNDFNDLVDAGINALGQDEPLKALSLLERAARLGSSPILSSSLAYCLARERGQVKTGRRTCEELIDSDPQNPFHHLNLGRILLLENDRSAAIDAFRRGMTLEPHPQIIDQLNLLGVRKPQILPFLARDNILNKYLGLLFKRG
jgi:Flp pilus assembly protein TadD